MEFDEFTGSGHHDSTRDVQGTSKWNLPGTALGEGVEGSYFLAPWHCKGTAFVRDGKFFQITFQS